MAAVSEIIVPRNHEVLEGDLIRVPGAPDMRVGRAFGAGFLAQNRIYQLLDAYTLWPARLVLKVCRPSAAARRSLAHEAKMYRNLALLARKHGPAVGTLFLQAHAVLLHEDRTIVGLVVEKANGKGVDKRVSDPAFHCVRYVLALLSDVLTALDVAQRELGLVHYDLKLDNVLEHWGTDAGANVPDTPAMQAALSAGRARGGAGGGGAAADRAPAGAGGGGGGAAAWELGLLPRFKIFDFGTSVVWPDPFSVAASGLGARAATGQPAGGAAAAPASLICSYLPCGGGRAAAAAAAASAAAAGSGGDRGGARDRGRVILVPAAAEALAEDAAAGGAGAPGRVAPAAGAAAGRGRGGGGGGAEHFEYSKPFFMVRLYHMWWLRRGDAYRLLASLARHLDGRTWPLEDTEEVTLLLAFLEHATGRKRRLRAKFVPRSQLEAGEPLRPAAAAAAPAGGTHTLVAPVGAAEPPPGGASAAGGPSPLPAVVPPAGPFAAPAAQQQLPFFGLADARPHAAAAAARPVAPPERPHVLGRAAPVRGAFAGQLLSEPLLLSLLSRLGRDVRAPSVADAHGFDDVALG